jgi:hypothetical protein
MQARLAGVIERRDNFLYASSLRHGAIAGKVREARVDRFEATPAGLFDCRIL